MHLPAWLGDVATGTEDDFAIVRAEADLAGQHDRMLVFAGVPVRRGQQAHLERMLDDGHLAAVGAAGELEHRPKTRERYVLSFPGLHNRHRNLIHIGHLAYLLASTTPGDRSLGVVVLGDRVVE